MALQFPQAIPSGPRLRPMIPFLLVGLLAGLLLLGLWIARQMPGSFGSTPLPEKEQPVAMVVPEVLTRPVVQKKQERAQEAPQASAQAAQVPPISVPPVGQQPVVEPAPLSSLRGRPQGRKVPQESRIRQGTPEEPLVSTGMPGKQEGRKKASWAMLATPPEEQGKPPPMQDQARKGPGTLIQPATWEIPVMPWMTLYRSQEIPVRLKTAINSDIPGQMLFETVIPIFDKFQKGVCLIEKGSLILASQGQVPVQGSSRLALKLEQLELPGGAVVALKGQIGETGGATGLPGKVDNHYGKLFLATGISALLNIGGRFGTGTPTEIHANPGQEVIRDTGNSIQQDSRAIVNQQLRIPPTLTIPAGTLAVIHLLHNIQFSKPPPIIP